MGCAPSIKLIIIRTNSKGELLNPNKLPSTFVNPSRGLKKATVSEIVPHSLEYGRRLFVIFAHCTWQESGYSDEEDAYAILTTYCFKKLAILSLREVVVLLRNRVNQIGIGNKETRKNNKQYIMRAIRAADLARLEHARMHEALRN